MLKYTIAERIVDRMEALHLNAKQLASRSGITYNSINNYIRGLNEPSCTNIVALAAALQCTTDYLLGIEDKSVALSKAHDKVEHLAAKATKLSLELQALERSLR